MSAALLRRAAAKLREHAEAASKGNWDESGTELYAASGGWVGETSGAEPEDEANARYVAMMHPPVALALADWLDDAAARTGIPEYPSYGLPEKAMAVARAVLREEES